MKSQQKIDTKQVMANLDKIRANVSKKTYIKIGVLGDAMPRTDDNTVSNPEIAAIQELGSVTNNIPPRSFLRMPVEQNVGAIAQFVSSPTILESVMQGKVVQALTKVGIYAETFVQKAFETRGFGQWKPNSPVTIDRKGSSSPLIDTGALRRSVSSEVING